MQSISDRTQIKVDIYLYLFGLTDVIGFVCGYSQDSGIQFCLSCVLSSFIFVVVVGRSQASFP